MVWIDNDEGNVVRPKTTNTLPPSTVGRNPFDKLKGPGAVDAGTLVREKPYVAPTSPGPRPNYGVMEGPPPPRTAPAPFSNTQIQDFSSPAPQSGGWAQPQEEEYYQTPSSFARDQDEVYVPMPEEGGFANPARPGGYNLGPKENYAITTDAIVSRWIEEAGPLAPGQSYDWEPIYNRARQVVHENIQPIVQQFRQANPTQEIDPWAQEAPITYKEYLDALAYQKQEADRQRQQYEAQMAAAQMEDQLVGSGQIPVTPRDAQIGLMAAEIAKKQPRQYGSLEDWTQRLSEATPEEADALYQKYGAEKSPYYGISNLMSARGATKELGLGDPIGKIPNKFVRDVADDALSPANLTLALLTGGASGLATGAMSAGGRGVGTTAARLLGTELAASAAGIGTLRATEGAPGYIRYPAALAAGALTGTVALKGPKATVQALTGGVFSPPVNKAYASSPYKQHIDDLVGGPEPKKPWKVGDPPDSVELPSDRIRTSQTDLNLLKAKTEDLLRSSADTISKKAKELRAWYEGGYQTELGDLNLDMKAGNDLMIRLGLAVRDGKRAVATDPERVKPIFRALHGLQAPETLDDAQRAIYTFARKMADKEELESFRFDPNFVMIEGDYFAQFWRMSDDVGQRLGRRRMGATPAYQLPRANGFDEALEKGLQPLTWNPVEMAAVRRELGVKTRQVATLVERMKKTGVAIDAKEAPADWRVPAVGPAFEGKPYAIMEGDAPAVRMTTKYAVPNGLADTLETMVHGPKNYGKWEIVWNVADQAKQKKLVLSLFQHVDMMNRMNSSIFAGALNDLRRGNIFGAAKKFAYEIPVDTARLIKSSLPEGVTGHARRSLQEELLSDTPVSKLRPDVTYRMLGEAGLRYYDSSVVRRDLGTVLGDIRKSATHGPVRRRLDTISESLNAGLFDGVVPTAQRHAIANHIGPQLIRQHPEYTAEQLARAIADEANIRFSTLGDYQSVIQQPTIKKFARLAVFSTNETEGLLRQAFGMVLGDAKAIRSQYFMSQLLYTAVVAELVHKATTGEWLPLDRLNPIEESPYGREIPGTSTKVAFRRDFLSPDIPFSGRNQGKLSLDLLGQADTVFRLLDPKGFVGARLGILPRAIWTQVQGKDFFGRDITSPRDRLATLASDLAEPISIHELRSATGFGPDTEGRIGKAGHGIQVSGFNVRGETNQDMRDRYAREYLNSLPADVREQIKGVNWSALTPRMQDDLLQKYPNLAEELSARNLEKPVPDTSDKQREDINFKYLREQEALDARFRAGAIGIDEWEMKTKQLGAKKAGEFEQLYKGLPESEVQNPLDDYYRIVNSHRISEIEVDWEAVQKELEAKSPEWRKFVDDNLRRNETDMQSRRRTDVAAIDESGFWDQTSDRTKWLLEHPEIQDKVRAWGYSKDTIAYLDKRIELRREQEADDAALASGSLTVQQWKDARKERLTRASAFAEGAFGPMDDLPEADKDAMDRYSDIIEKNKSGNKIDWDKVEADVAKLPEADQKAIDAYVSIWSTPKEQEYKAALKRLDEAHWFDLEPALYRQWAAKYKVQETQEEFTQKLRGYYYNQYIKKGAPEGAAANFADAMTESYINKAWKKRYSDYREAMYLDYRRNNPQAAKDVLQWDLYGGTTLARAALR